MAHNGDHVQQPLPPGADDWDDEPLIGPQQQQQPFMQFNGQPAPQWRCPPWWQPYGQQQPAAPVPQPHRVNLKPLWTNNVKTWFSLAEATFQQYNIVDSRMKFNLVLPALDNDTLGRTKAVVDNPERLQAPYEALKARLAEIYEPDVWENASRLLHMRELGDLKPSQLMDSMRALLPASELPGILFKSVFLARLPGDMRDHVQAQAELLTCEELAKLADNIWQSRNAHRSSLLASLSTCPPPTPGDGPVDELEDTVAALSLRKKPQQEKKWTKKPSARKGGQKSKMVCWKHLQYGEKAHSCADKENCAFTSEN